MKTIILVAALTGFMALSSTAQTRQCMCKKKTVARTASHKKTVRQPVAVAVPKSQPVCVTRALDKEWTASGISGGSVCDTAGLGYSENRSFTGNYPGDKEVDVTGLPRFADLEVTSTAFTDMGIMPPKYTCEGNRASPPLSIGNIPDGTKSLAVIMYDPRATTTGGETYWLMWDIDNTNQIPENFVNDHAGINTAKEYGYNAVCPAGGKHYYHFMVYALDTKLYGNKHTTKAKLQQAMRGHVLAKGELVGVYDRP